MEEFCRRVREGLDQATWEQKRQLIEWLVVRVIVTDGEVEIRYAIPTSPAGEGTRFCQLRADYRAALGKAQGVARYRNPLRENRLKLHGRPLPRRSPRLAQVITGLSSPRARDRSGRASLRHCGRTGLGAVPVVSRYFRVSSGWLSTDALRLLAPSALLRDRGKRATGLG
jgi:hypothetical protein